MPSIKEILELLRICGIYRSSIDKVKSIPVVTKTVEVLGIRCTSGYISVTPGFQEQLAKK
jgi:hypothetical protein